jgi:hypothetical protein
VLVLACVGCGENSPPAGPNLATPSPVKGKITFPGGSPLIGGMIVFKPVERMVGSQMRFDGGSVVNEKGEYIIGYNGDGKGVPPGDYKVVITPRETAELRNSNSSRIPKPYLDESTTPVKLTVKAEENTFDIELK